jgi:hypothetical protein
VPQPRRTANIDSDAHSDGDAMIYLPRLLDLLGIEYREV